MEKVRTFEKCKIARATDGITVLVDGPDELLNIMDGSFFEDNCMKKSLKTLPQNPGFYIADIEVWYEQGYDSDGYPHPGESGIDIRLINVNILYTNQQDQLPSCQCPADKDQCAFYDGDCKCSYPIET